MSLRADVLPPSSSVSTLWMVLVAFLLLASMVMGNEVKAEQVVSGDITANTTWLAGQSPYVVVGDVTVVDNAILTIEPGVTILMATNTNLTVRQGALQAMGRSDSPILFTSGASSPAPGDWGQIRFLDNTLDAVTYLRYVNIEYGSGSVIERASPQLEHVTLTDNRGAAITTDLASSPYGTGLMASGNDLNGILVPAGTIGDEVQWGLIGIPYVLDMGVIQIGSGPIVLTPAALRLSPGVTGNMRIGVDQVAPAGGWNIDLTSRVPLIADVPATATIPEGSDWVDFTITAGNEEGDTTITASNASLGVVTAAVRVAALPTLQMLPTSATIGINSPKTMTLRLPDSADRAVTVTLSSSNPNIVAIPGTVTIPAGTQSVTFDATGLSDGESLITAQALGYTSATTSLTVNARAIVLPISALVAPGGSIDIPVSLTSPAPVGGLTLNLAASPATPLSLSTPTITLAEGATSGSFSVQGVSAGSSVVTVTAENYLGADVAITVDNVSAYLSPTGAIEIPINLTATRRVRLSAPAPAGGVTLSLAVSDPGVIGVTPAEIHVPEGQLASVESVFVQGLAQGTATVSVVSPGYDSTAVNVTVIGPLTISILAHAGSTTSTIVGKQLNTSLNDIIVRRYVNGVLYAGSEPLSITLTSEHPGSVGVPAKVEINAGSSLRYLSVTGKELDSSVAITASCDGCLVGNDVVSVDVVQSTLTISGQSDVRAIGSERDGINVTISPDGSAWGVQLAAEDVVIALSIADASPAGIVDGIYGVRTGGEAIGQAVISAGTKETPSPSGTYSIYIGVPQAAGTYYINATAPGVGSAISPQQQVEAPMIQVRSNNSLSDPGSAEVGKYMRTGITDLYVERVTSSGLVFKGAEALTVSVVSSQPSLASVVQADGVVEILAGQSRAYFSVAGKAIGAGVQLTASAPEYGTIGNPLSVTVSEPRVRIANLANSRSIESERDRFNVYLDSYQGAQLADVNLHVVLEAIDQVPAGGLGGVVVEGVYDALTDGSLVNSAEIEAGRNGTISTSGTYGYRYIGTPVQAGEYTVGAYIDGSLVGSSAVQSVLPPQLSIRADMGSSDVTAVGKGMQTNALYDLVVYRMVDGVSYNGVNPLVVTLASSDSNIVEVNDTVTIPAGSSKSSFVARGVDLGSATLSASAEGYVVIGTPVTVGVVEPSVTISGLDGNRSILSERDSFTVNVVPAMSGRSWQSPWAPLPVALSVIDQMPEGVVSGIYSALAGGESISATTIDVGQTSSAAAYVERPTQNGQYKISALPSGGSASALSSIQYVETAGLRMTTHNVSGTIVVGRGTKTVSGDVSVERVANGEPFSGAEAVTVELSCITESEPISDIVCSVDPTVVIPAGASSVPIAVIGEGIGQAHLHASATGYDDGELGVSGVKPYLTINSLLSTISVGNSDLFYADIKVPGAYSTPRVVSPLSVNLISSVPSVGTVTSSVLINAGSNTSSNASFSAIASGTTEVTASAPGVDASAPFVVTVP